MIERKRRILPAVSPEERLRGNDRLVFVGIFDSFFFQAEDGIRDVAVTGVQTCALPISPRSSSGSCGFPRTSKGSRPTYDWDGTRRSSARSEERRVGKECRSRWSPY